jgi:thiol-disulfide isomerase/thioredoxin
MWLLVYALVGLLLLGIIFSGFALFQLIQPAPPAYEFKTGVNHPQEIKDLMKNGTVVLYFTENNCPPCDDMTPKVAVLQSQYNGTNVTFATFNLDDNATSMNIAKKYGIQWVPQVFVIRTDGAVANFTYNNSTPSGALLRMGKRGNSLTQRPQRQLPDITRYLRDLLTCITNPLTEN